MRLAPSPGSSAAVSSIYRSFRRQLGLLPTNYLRYAELPSQLSALIIIHSQFYRIKLGIDIRAILQTPEDDRLRIVKLKRVKQVCEMSLLPICFLMPVPGTSEVDTSELEECESLRPCTRCRVWQKGKTPVGANESTRFILQDHTRTYLHNCLAHSFRSRCPDTRPHHT